jgi:PST family polysaccharide transporter
VSDALGNETSENRWVGWLPHFIQDRITGRSNLQSILANTGWLVFDRIFRMVTGVAVSIWIARHFGPSLFGNLNYATSFATILGSMASLGLESIVVRGLIRDKDLSGHLLGTALVMRMASGLAVVFAAFFAAYVIPNQNAATKIMIVCIAAGYVAQSLDIVDYWFQAKLASRYSVIAKNVAYVIVSALKIVALLMGLPIVVFAILATAEILIAGICLLIAYRTSGERVRSWRFDKRLSFRMLRDGWPLTISGLVVVIYMKIDQVLLGNMMDAASVGVYAAAVRLVEMWYFVPGALVVSVLPSIVRARQENPLLYQRRLQQLYDLMAVLSICIAIVVTIGSRQIIGILYGGEYGAAAAVVTIYIWSGVPTFLGVASSQYLLSENLTRISLYRTSIGMVLNILLNLLLIPKYGISGSAVATLISYSAATFSVVLFKQSRNQATMMLKSLFIVRGVANIFPR